MDIKKIKQFLCWHKWTVFRIKRRNLSGSKIRSCVKCRKIQYGSYDPYVETTVWDNFTEKPRFNLSKWRRDETKT